MDMSPHAAPPQTSEAFGGNGHTRPLPYAEFADCFTNLSRQACAGLSTEYPRFMDLCHSHAREWLEDRARSPEPGFSENVGSVSSLGSHFFQVRPVQTSRLSTNMGRRERWISDSIQYAILYDVQVTVDSVISIIICFFRIFKLLLVRFKAPLFSQLREKTWQLDPDEYADSFMPVGESGGQGAGLNPVGDLGYSGSTFFATPNSKYVIKSLPRSFEYSFFEQDLVQQYDSHMRAHADSLLIRITDYLTTPHPALGALLGLTPSRHMIMENLLYGRDASSAPDEWENYDLKPSSYFFPERDIAGGRLASEATKSRLVDEFPDKIRITAEQWAALRELLHVDTQLLAAANVVDYSLFLVRFPATMTAASVKSTANQWRDGVESADGKWKYRAALLDFFWAKHKMAAIGMTALVQSFNIFGKREPMSITTDPQEFQERFMNMIQALVEINEP